MSNAFANTKKITLEAKVIRADGTIEDLGMVAAFHRNPLLNLLMKLRGKGRITCE